MLEESNVVMLLYDEMVEESNVVMILYDEMDCNHMYSDSLSMY
jgi:hypothetical protein